MQTFKPLLRNESLNFSLPIAATVQREEQIGYASTRTVETNTWNWSVGKCHFDAHKDAQTKPEIDIEEYFKKLAKFLNE